MAQCRAMNYARAMLCGTASAAVLLNFPCSSQHGEQAQCTSIRISQTGCRTNTLWPWELQSKESRFHSRRVFPMQHGNCSVILWTLTFNLLSAPFDDANVHSPCSHLLRLCLDGRNRTGGVSGTAEVGQGYSRVYRLTLRHSYIISLSTVDWQFCLTNKNGK